MTQEQTHPLLDLCADGRLDTWPCRMMDRLRRSMERLGGRLGSQASPDEDCGDPAASHLWAEGPLPGGLADCIHCGKTRQGDGAVRPVDSRAPRPKGGTPDTLMPWGAPRPLH